MTRPASRMPIHAGWSNTWTRSLTFQRRPCPVAACSIVRSVRYDSSLSQAVRTRTTRKRAPPRAMRNRRPGIRRRIAYCPLPRRRCKGDGRRVGGGSTARSPAPRYRTPPDPRGCTIPPAMKTLLPLLLAFTGVSMSIPASADDSPATTMAAAARTLLGTLDPAQKTKAQLPFDSEERFNWFYIPKDRVGLPLKQMTPAQREATLALLHAGLSEKGYTKAEAIRALEPVLAEIEKNPVRRDPELDYVSIFGDPSPSGTWGWRYEGHHLSQNWTVVRGQSIASSPQFFGSNPAEVRDGPKQGTRVLAAEEDLARALLEGLTDAQRAKAVISTEAPDDMLTANNRKAAMQEDRGLSHEELTPEQRGLLMAVIEEYASAQQRSIAQKRLEAVRTAGLGKVKFAWMGGLERGKRHYYRIQGPTFLIEYDNTQNDANHIHAVWRDFNGDFGLDLLSEHYRTSPHHADARHRHEHPQGRSKA